MITSKEIKAALLQYYRYDKQFQLVALEAQHFHNADVVAVNGRWVVETEVKVSIADMKVDIEKPKHEVMRRDYLQNNPAEAPLLHPHEWRHAISEFLPQLKWKYEYEGHRFFFAVPEELTEEAERVRSTYYPYAGLLVVRTEPYIYSLSMFGIKTAKEAYHFTKPKADFKLLTFLVKDQSATLVRLAVENCKHMPAPGQTEVR